MNGMSKHTAEGYIRNFIFGVEDSLVSTVGLLSGIAAADVPGRTIFLTGAVLVVVEALSMGVGSLLSESSAEEYTARRGVSMRRSVRGGIIMFVSYFVAGFVPLAPYALLDATAAFPVSIGASLVALFLLGSVSAMKYHARVMRSGLRMLILGGIAIAAGVAVGGLLKTF